MAPRRLAINKEPISLVEFFLAQISYNFFTYVDEE